MEKRVWSKAEVDQYRKQKDQLFYFNKDDKNFLVQKSGGFGRTFNFAHPASWFVLSLILGFIIYRLMVR